MNVGSLPLIVLTAAPQAPSDKNPLPREWQIAIGSVHQQLQRELVAVSTDGRHIIASKAGHNIQLDEPQLVLDAITGLVTQAREAASN
jgi:pimeloyl-ACP methyl ester carboxylesterase